MPEARVLFGDVCGPSSVWMVPDRQAVGDLKCVKKVVRLEKQLAELCCEEERDLFKGKLVAVRHETLVVRAKVENVQDGQVLLFLSDWGVRRLRPAGEVMKVPETLRLPRCLAHKVNLHPDADVASLDKKFLEELVAECSSGILSDQRALSDEEVTGTLTVQLRASSQFVTRHHVFLRGLDLSSVCVNSLLLKQNCHLASTTFMETSFKCEDIDQNVPREPVFSTEPSYHQKEQAGSKASPSSRTLSLAGFDGDDMFETGVNNLPEPLVASAQGAPGARSAVKTTADDEDGSDSDVESLTSIAESLRSNASLEVDNLLITRNAGLSAARVVVPLQHQVQVGQTSGGRTKEELLAPCSSLQLPLVHTLPGSRALVPESKVSALPWPADLQVFLEQQGVTEARTLQTIMWPAVSKLQSLLVVAPPSKTTSNYSWAEGKTLGWLLPILAILSEPPASQETGPQPRLVVICPGLELVTLVAALINQVAIGARIALKIVEDAAGVREVEPSVFINGIDVLVTTPRRLVDRMVEQAPLTGLQRCSHLVLEEVDMLLERCPAEMRTILATWSECHKGRGGQVVALAERWSNDLSALSCTLKLAVVVTNMMEAVVYSKFPVFPSFFSSLASDDSDEVGNHLKSVVSVAKGNVLVCCSSPAPLPHICNILNSHHPVVLKSTNLVELTQQWPFGKAQSPSGAHRTLLIITDQALATLASASLVLPSSPLTLIHWDLPAEGRKAFERRFCLLRSASCNIHQDPREMSTRTEVHLLLRPHDAPVLPSIMDFLRRCDSKVPEELEVFHTGAMIARERRQQLCSNLEKTGRCKDWKRGRCSERHRASPLDLDDKVLTGVVTFTVLRVETPVVYWVKMTRQQDERRFGSDDGLHLAMARFFSSPQARKVVKVVEKGLLVAAEGRDGLIRRARVQVLVYKQVVGGGRQLEKLEVFTVDEGLLEVVNPGEVYELPESLSASAFPPAAMCLIIAGLKPQDEDTAWGNVTVNVSSVMHSRKGEEAICRARVLLHLGSTLWVERVQLMVRQSSIATYVAKFDSAQDLVNEGWAVPNPEHLGVLEDLAQQAGTALALSNPDLGSIGQHLMAREVEKQRQSFLPRAEKVAVYMTECLTPEHFYVAKVGDVNSLQELERELGAWAVEEGYPRFTFDPSVGQVVMVQPDEGGGWQRARVLAKLGAKEIGEGGDGVPMVEERLRVFCLDSGETLDLGGRSLGACPANLISKIPFQAVRCLLAGWGDWGEGAADELFEMSRDKNDEALPLWCKVVDVDDGKYRIRLVDEREDGVGDLGEHLGKLGLAIKDEIDDVEECSFEEGWDAPCGLPDVLDLDQVLAATKAVGQNILQEEKEESDFLSVPNAKPFNSPETLPAPLNAPIVLSVALPHLKIIKSRVNLKTLVPGVLWSQNANSILLRLDVAAMVDLNLDQVHLRLRGRELVVEVAQVEEGEVRLHSTGTLTLWGDVKQSGTIVKVTGPKVQVILTKATLCTWAQLASQKFGWIRQDLNGLFDDIGWEGEEEKETLKLERGFLEPYLVDSICGETTKRYHPLTGETVMAEQAFMTDSSCESDGDSNDECEQ